MHNQLFTLTTLTLLATGMLSQPACNAGDNNEQFAQGGAIFKTLERAEKLADKANSGKWVELFDGKTLKGWEVRGGFANYKVKEGAIVGTTVEGSSNTFLCTKDYSDFELEFDVLCHTKLNSGCQIRSHVYEKDTAQPSNPKRVRPKGNVYGYQCEIAHNGTAGNFWDEARRTKWLDETDDKAQKAFKHNEWNHYRIVAKGDHIQSWVNGVKCADFHDKTDASGFIGLQVHGIKKGTGPYTVRWKNIKLRELN